MPTEPRPLAERFHLLLWISLGFLAVRAVHFAATYGETYLIQWVGQRVLFDLRSDLFAKLMRLHPGFYDRNPVGRLMTRVTSDVDAINQFITGGLVGVIADLFTLVGLLGFMLFLSPKLTLVVLLVAPVLLAVTTWVRLGMRSAYREMRLRLARVNAALQENLSGVETIQLFVKEREREEKFDRLNRDLFRAWVEIIRWFALFFPVVGFLGDFAVASLVYYGGGEVVRGAVSLGLLVAFVDYTRQLFQPLQDLSDKFNLFQGAMASAERIFGVLDTEEELKDPEDPTPIRSFRGEVEFRDVWLAYTPKGVEPTEKDWVLKGVSFRVRPGEKVALVGATGAGKTSVVSLIARFYDPQRGCVFLDGVDVRRYRQEELRRHVGIVLQEPFLFSGTVLDNLRLFDPSVPPERVEEVSRFLGAHEFILRLPKGYQTVLGERGRGFPRGRSSSSPWCGLFSRAPTSSSSWTRPRPAWTRRRRSASRRPFTRPWKGGPPHHRPPPLHHPPRGPHPRLPQGEARGGGEPRGASGQGRLLRRLVPAPVPGGVSDLRGGFGLALREAAHGGAGDP